MSDCTPTNVIFITDKIDWAEASLAKKQLAWHLKNNKNGMFDEAIEKEIELVRSFKKKAA